MKKPDFFIVGAPKCGTTAMNDYLKQHPDIYIPGKKELHFFGSDLKFNRPRPTEEEYLSYFSGATCEKRVGEASVWYFYSKLSAAEIKRFCPSASILIMLRNPVDMIYSLHSQFLYTGHEDIFDFQVAIDAEQDRKRGLRVPDSPLLRERLFCKEILFYAEVVKYAHQVQRYLDIFGRENVLIILFDDFKSDTAGVYRETLRFLGVNEDFQAVLRIANPNRNYRSIVLQRLLSTHSTKIVRCIGKLMPHRQRLAVRQNLRKFNTRYGPRPPMDPKLKRRLQAEFVSEVERLSEVLGRDLTCWSKD